MVTVLVPSGGADDGAEGVGEEGAVGAWQLAALVEEAGQVADADQRAGGVEDVDEEEGEHHRHQRQRGEVAQVEGERVWRGGGAR